MLSKLAMEHFGSVIVGGCRLTLLDLQKNSIGDRGVETLLSCFGDAYSLKTSDLSNNDITSEGATLVASAVCSSLVHIEELVVSGNPIGTEGAHALFSSLGRSCLI